MANSEQESKRLALVARNLAATRLLYRVSMVARVEHCASAEMNRVLVDIKNIQ